MKRSDFLRAASASAAALLLPVERLAATGNAQSVVDSFGEESLIYHNPLATENDVKDFRTEGEAKASFPNGRLRLEPLLDASLGQKSNFVYWCPMDFPKDIAVTWNFYPLKEPGLCMFFFAATGRNGEDIFHPSLATRTGEYDQYNKGDINSFHVSYYRRNPKERKLNICNLRKSYGFHLVATGADPLPSVQYAQPPYAMKVVKKGSEVSFFIEGIQILHFVDDGKTYGPLLGGGKIGFRQMAPLVGEYSELKVYEVKCP